MDRDKLDPKMAKVHDEIERIRLEVLNDTGHLPSHREVATKLLGALEDRQENLN